MHPKRPPKKHLEELLCKVKKVYKVCSCFPNNCQLLLRSLFIVSLENREHNGNWTPFTALWRKFPNSRPSVLGLQVHWWYLDRCAFLTIFSIPLFLMGSRTLTTKNLDARMPANAIFGTRLRYQWKHLHKMFIIKAWLGSGINDFPYLLSGTT